MPVGVKRAEVFFPVPHFIKPHLRVPAFHRFRLAAASGGGRKNGFLPARGVEPHRGALLKTDPEQMAEQVKHAVDHTADRQIRAQGLGIEGVFFLPLQFRPIAVFPRGQRGGRRAGFPGFEIFQRLRFPKEKRPHPRVQILHKRQRLVAAPRHAPGNGKVREIFLPEQARLLVAQLQDLPDQRGVVPFPRRADLSQRFPTFLPQCVAFRIL